MVGCRCGVGVENVITLTALSRRLDGVEGVSWRGTGSDIISEQHFMFAVAKRISFITGITFCEITSFLSFFSIEM